MSDVEDSNSVLLHSTAGFRSPSPQLIDPRDSLRTCTFVDPKEEELEGLLYAARHGDIQAILALLESYYSGSLLNLNATRYQRQSLCVVSMVQCSIGYKWNVARNL